MNKPQTALITGASSGIGEATAKLLAEKKYRLIICGRNSSKLNNLKAELSKKSEVESLTFDIRQKDNVFKAIETLPGQFRNINVLINNAGNAHGLASIQDGSVEDWDAMIDGNVKGLLYVTKAVLPLMKAQEKKHIINIGSIAGKEVYKNGNVYCASKYAVDALNTAMRYDFQELGIKVSEINPGLVETGFSEVRFKGDKAKANSVYRGFTPLRASDIADLIYYVISAPAHVNIAETLILPSDQAASTMVKKSN
ncbi:SDR family NAD(P)-dependent oxidoreductase [Hyphobacterium sp. CCMP332]|nr:SDR family NAD(P)-dependent oxidoreductase [Hyphobacterium sp. CCMP332]